MIGSNQSEEETKMRLYKLTDSDGYTCRGKNSDEKGYETLWMEGLIVSASAEGTELCTNQVIHAYTSPLLALLLNPIHANIENPQLWEAEGEVVATDGLKVGVKSLTTLRKIEVPAISLNQRVRFAIYCALEVCADSRFVAWANGWLNCTDRSEAAARRKARQWTWGAARLAAWAAADAAWTAEAAAGAAEAAAARAGAKLDLAAIAEKAIAEEK